MTWLMTLRGQWVICPTVLHDDVSDMEFYISAVAVALVELLGSQVGGLPFSAHCGEHGEHGSWTHCGHEASHAMDLI